MRPCFFSCYYYYQTSREGAGTRLQCYREDKKFGEKKNYLIPHYVTSLKQCRRLNQVRLLLLLLLKYIYVDYTRNRTVVKYVLKYVLVFIFVNQWVCRVNIIYHCVNSLLLRTSVA